MHIVHVNINDQTKFGAIAIFFNAGGLDHPLISQSINAISEMTEIDLMSLFPSCELTDFYTYPGSLTFPPCTENVNWHVLPTPLQMSDSQLKWFTSVWADDPSFACGNGNVRDVQPINDREVLHHTRCNH
jgi:carbonic anhydrase